MTLTCLLIIKTLINNDCNVWQPPVAKHCLTTFLPLTTTIPNLAVATAVVVCPCHCPFGPSRGCSSSSTTHTHHHQQLPPHHDAYTSSPPPNDLQTPRHRLQRPPTRYHRRRRAPNATSPPLMAACATSPPLTAACATSPPLTAACATSPLLTTAYATSPSLTTAKRHITDAGNLRCHVTVADHSSCQVSVDEQPRYVTTATSPLLEGYGCRNQQVGSEEEWGGWERERGGKGRGNEDAGELGRGRLFVPPPSLFSFQEPTRRMRRCKNHTPPRSSSIIPPRCGGGRIFIQTGARESHTPPPFLFVSNGGGVNPTRRPPFFSISNGGGVWHSRHPPVSFHFARGQRESYTLPLVSFRFEQGQCESHTLPPVSLCFEQGQCESHMPPLFLFLYPQWWGGI